MKKNTDGTPWYKDAVIYELHVRSFFDSNGDGMGDFKGLIAKLDYLRDLGVNAVWLLPFYPSPWRDDGYDISDYTGIHQVYGTLRDFKRFLREAHDRDLRVITELVINHTSNQHPWFERARNAKQGSKWRDFYVWSDSPERYEEARIIFQDFETSNWSWDPTAKAYYWHRFYSHQPDLNFENPDVQQAVFKVLDFWFSMGIDGLRLDAVPYLFERENTNCENLPETHGFLKQLRSYVDGKYDERMLLAEANQWPEDAVPYFGDGDECHMAFHFPLMPRLFMSVKMEDSFPVTDILEQTPVIPDTCQWSIFLRNHDELTLEMVTDEERDYMYSSFGTDPRHRINLGIRRRLAPLLDNDRRKIELLNILLFSLPGTPVIYYGDEIGMGDNVYLGDRDGVRTPMQWSSDKNAGFSKANPQSLYLPVIIDPEYHYEAINIETQQRNASSLLWWMKRVIATRRRFPAFSRGSIEFVHTDNNSIFSFIRQYEDQAILVIVNFSRYTQSALLDLSAFAGRIPEEIFSQNEFPRISDSEYFISIGSSDYYWFFLKKEEEYSEGKEKGRGPMLKIGARDWNSFSPVLKESLEDSILYRYIRHSRWYREKTRKVRKIEIRDRFLLSDGDEKGWLIICRIDFADDKSETYVISLAVTVKEEAERTAEENPHAVICRLRYREEDGILYDALYNEGMRDNLLTLFMNRKKIKGQNGEVRIQRSRNLRQLSRDLEEPYASRVLRVEQSNTSIMYRDTFFFKLYRKLEDGVNPDVELLRFLTEKTKFSHIPQFAGNLEYCGGDHRSASLGLLVSFVPNQGDAWSYAGSSIDRYFENLLERQKELPKSFSAPQSIFGVKDEDIPDFFVDAAGGLFLEMIKLLGRRTGELHIALSSNKTDPEFKPEAFSKLYQRSVYQSLRSLLKRINSMLKKARSKADEDIREAVDEMLAYEDKILSYFAQINGEKIKAEKIRIHGDYHLGQVLFTGKDFVIIDLEGEPARSLSERRLKYSAFRDVAGMIRSFHYAVYQKYLHYSEVRREDSSFIEAWLRPWYTYVSAAFLNAYLSTVDGAGFVPEDPGKLQRVLNIFILEKAVYEVGYEINNRPGWLMIPLAGIRFILETLDGASS